MYNLDLCYVVKKVRKNVSNFYIDLFRGKNLRIEFLK